MKTKKRVLKKGIEKVCITISTIYVMFILFTIDTLSRPINDIIQYIVLLTILSIISLPCIYLLIKYTNLFEEE